MAPSVAIATGTNEDSMLRRVSFALSIAAAASLAGCGRQITPEPALTNLAGKVLIRFRTVGPMDFNTYDYQIVLDTCGGGTPHPNVALTTYKDFSYSFNVGSTTSFGASTVRPILLQYALRTNNLNPQLVPLDPSTTTLISNSNGQNTEFTLIFARASLDNPLQIAQPCPSTPPNADKFGQSTTWSLNFFTIATGNNPVSDSLGSAGPNDTSYTFSIDTTQAISSLPVPKNPGIPISPSAAALATGEIENYL